MINLHLSGHICLNSATSSDDSCGNCDGGCCGPCRKFWTVDGDEGLNRFYNIDQAKALDEELGNEFWSLTRFPRQKYVPSGVEYYLNDEGELVADFWIEGRHIVVYIVVCDPESMYYNTRYLKAHEELKKWAQCPCVDKAEPYCANSCDVVGCKDFRCHHEVTHQGRKERKWYM